jgi:hypothetical protein
LNKDLGFDIRATGGFAKNPSLGIGSLQTFCREIEKIPGVAAASQIQPPILGFNNSTEELP